MISGVSTRSIQMALQRSMASLQREMAVKQIEVQTGRRADIGISLGEKSAASVSLLRDSQRLDSILETNKLAAARLEATQHALETFKVSADSMMSALTAGSQTIPGRALAADSARSALATMTSALNISIGGQHVFGGLNSDTPPIDPGNGIPGGVEMDAAFLSFFGFAKSDPAAASISASAFEIFVSSEIEPIFMGSGWNASISSASNAVIQSRITLKEVAGTSVSANETGIREGMFAAALAANFLAAPLSGPAADVIVNKSLTLGVAAAADVAASQSRAGLVEQRLSDASARTSMQRDLLLSLSGDLTSVDPYETSVRLNALLTQIETSYALTQKIQNLSILRYLG